MFSTNMQHKVVLLLTWTCFSGFFSQLFLYNRRCDLTILGKKIKKNEKNNKKMIDIAKYNILSFLMLNHFA